jgi:D-amino-acid dehydrogenase
MAPGAVSISVPSVLSHESSQIITVFHLLKHASSSHVTVIGAGIVGVSTAAFLQRAGHQATVIDRLPPGEGCSFGNAGGIAFAEIMPTIHPKVFTKIPGWLMDPLGPLTIRWRYLPKALPWFLAAARNATASRFAAITEARAQLGLRAVADVETLFAGAGVPDLLAKQETLRVFDSAVQFQSEADERALKAKHGFPVETLTGDEAREMEPALSYHITHAATHGGWYFVRNPGRAVKAVAEQVLRDGGTFIADDVVGIDLQDGKVASIRLRAGGGRQVDQLVICAGAYSHQLARMMGDRILLEAERGYHIVLPNSGIALGRSVSYARTPGAATPMEMGLRLAGTDEFAGLDAPPNYARADKLWSLFKMIFPGMNPPDEAAKRWMGRRPGTPDSLPVIGRATHAKNVWYGFGHGHMGLTWGPTTGRLLSELISGKTPNMDLAAFRPGRF